MALPRMVPMARPQSSSELDYVPLGTLTIQPCSAGELCGHVRSTMQPLRLIFVWRSATREYQTIAGVYLDELELERYQRIFEPGGLPLELFPPDPEELTERQEELRDQAFGIEGLPVLHPGAPYRLRFRNDGPEPVRIDASLRAVVMR